MTIATRHRAPHWRILHRLIALAHVDRHPTARDLVTSQGVANEHLEQLEEACLIRATITSVRGSAGRETVWLSDVKDRRKVWIHLTSAGRGELFTPFSLVVRVLGKSGAVGGGRRLARHVREEASVNDADLHELAEHGIIEGFTNDGELVDLAAFGAIPGHVFLRLTRRGRTYAAR